MDELEIYRGDTFEFDHNVTNEETGENYVFSKGDSLECGIKRNTVEDTEYIVHQTKEIETEADTVTFCFSAEEMKKASTGDAILEVQLTTAEGKVYTTYQEPIKIKGDVINE